MTTMTVRMSDEDAELVRKYVRFEGTTISEFARSAMLEKIEDHADLQELRAAMTDSVLASMMSSKSLINVSQRP